MRSVTKWAMLCPFAITKPNFPIFWSDVCNWTSNYIFPVNETYQKINVVFKISRVMKGFGFSLDVIDLKLNMFYLTKENILNVEAL